MIALTREEDGAHLEMRARSAREALALAAGAAVPYDLAGMADRSIAPWPPSADNPDTEGDALPTSLRYQCRD